MKKLINAVSVISILLSAFLFYNCPHGTQVVFPEDTLTVDKPVWPQAGFNAAMMGSININIQIQSVNNTNVIWQHDFGQDGFYSDGGEFCIDVNGNIYFMNQNTSSGGLYKFNSNGEVLWIIDSLIFYNYGGISINESNDRLYFAAGKLGNPPTVLYCIDTDGNVIWTFLKASPGIKPVIGRDGTIYTGLAQGFAAINPDGTLKWLNPAISPMYANYKFALDKDDNVIISPGNVKKLSSQNGSMLWEFTNIPAGFRTYGVVIDNDENVYFSNSGMNQSGLYSLRNDGNLRWYLGNGSSTIPVLTSENYIITNAGPDIAAYDKEGNQLWRYGNASFDAHLLIDRDDNIYFLNYPMLSITSLHKSGAFRFSRQLSSASSLQTPALSPTGGLLAAPKRPRYIYFIK